MGHEGVGLTGDWVPSGGALTLGQILLGHAQPR